jgi:hypothetical protein
MIDLFHGKELRELELADVESLLDDAGAEPLHWEAKGIEIRPGEVRRQICGFANSHDGGFLILGTDVRGGKWQLEGVEFPDDDAPSWISSVAAGVQPYPEGLDSRPIKVTDGRWVVVVWIPPTPTPPCNAHGTVYERVSGKTLSVRESLRLSELFARGDAARVSAATRASNAARAALAVGRIDEAQAEHVQFGLGLAAAGYQGDLDARVFSEAFERGAASSIATHLSPGPLAPTGLEIVGRRVTQDARAFRVESQDRLLGYTWHVDAGRDGSVGIFCLSGVTQSEIQSLINGPVRMAWLSAIEILDMLDPRGPRYLRLAVAGGQFPANLAGIAEPPVVSRGPLDGPFGADVLASIERELHRTAGRMAYESPSAGAAQS